MVNRKRHGPANLEVRLITQGDKFVSRADRHWPVLLEDGTIVWLKTEDLREGMVLDNVVYQETSSISPDISRKIVAMHDSDYMVAYNQMYVSVNGVDIPTMAYHLYTGLVPNLIEEGLIDSLDDLLCVITDTGEQDRRRGIDQYVISEIGKAANKYSDQQADIGSMRKKSTVEGWLGKVRKAESFDVFKALAEYNEGWKVFNVWKKGTAVDVAWHEIANMHRALTIYFKQMQGLRPDIVLEEEDEQFSADSLEGKKDGLSPGGIPSHPKAENRYNNRIIPLVKAFGVELEKAGLKKAKLQRAVVRDAPQITHKKEDLDTPYKLRVLKTATSDVSTEDAKGAYLTCMNLRYVLAQSFDLYLQGVYGGLLPVSKSMNRNIMLASNRFLAHLCPEDPLSNMNVTYHELMMRHTNTYPEVEINRLEKKLREAYEHNLLNNSFSDEMRLRGEFPGSENYKVPSDAVAAVRHYAPIIPGRFITMADLQHRLTLAREPDCPPSFKKTTELIRDMERQGSRLQAGLFRDFGVKLEYFTTVV
jgi:hypothetical protein